jgi:acetylornithine/succinyldiaminopimelate/putrescine aminotransferase
MNMPTTPPELAEPHIRGWMAAVGLDAEYVRASGNLLYLADAAGREAEVIDFAGGFGSLVLGHNHPELVAHARDLLEAGVPIHAQFSRSQTANRAAALLSEIIQRETGSKERHLTVFANSGAEAVEVAIKHAELDRVNRLAALEVDIDSRLRAAGELVRGGAPVDNTSGYPLPVEDHDRPAGAGPGLLERAIRDHNAAAMARPPVLLALEGAFHGKLVGSLQITHNPGFRQPFAALGRPARFVPVNQPEHLVKAFEQERVSLLAPVDAGGVVRIVEREFSLVTALVLEPIQGEGGIVPLQTDFARAAREVCTRYGIPLVIDEIQSGMGRTGRFLASSELGIQGDYYVLAKALGGGIAKAAATVVRESRYRPEFEYLHSSTFARDGLSTAIALRVLEILERDGGAAYRRAREAGGHLREMLLGLQAEFPDVVREVRGRALMLGLEFQDQSSSRSAVIREYAGSGFFGYAAAGHLLQHHRIRVFPTASATTTLRFEPSIYLTGGQIDSLRVALRSVCARLRDHDEDLFPPLPPM